MKYEFASGLRLPPSFFTPYSNSAGCYVSVEERERVKPKPNPGLKTSRYRRKAKLSFYVFAPFRPFTFYSCCYYYYYSLDSATGCLSSLLQMNSFFSFLGRKQKAVMPNVSDPGSAVINFNLAQSGSCSEPAEVHENCHSIRNVLRSDRPPEALFPLGAEDPSERPIRMYSPLSLSPPF